MSLRAVLEHHRVVVCVGTGGVGKTTTAAALALQGAIDGRRAMVLTIDPARRLAQALGLEELSNAGDLVPSERLHAAGVEVRGSLTAGMLDQKSAWDEFIARHAPSAEIRDAVLANPFYQHLSRTFAGSTEYMAIEELYRINESGAYDLIVLDTPPTAHALDFLEAPRRLEEFLDRSIVAWLVKPYVTVGWAAWKTASRTARFVMRRIEEATGVSTLRQISEFFIAMEALFDGIAERSRRVRGLLASEETAFILVAGPEEQTLGESEALTTKMHALGVHLRGVVMNRVHPMPGEGELYADRKDVRALLSAWLRRDPEAAIVDWVWRTYRDAGTLARAEAVRLEVFEQGLEPAIARVAVEEMAGDVHDLSALAAMARALCPPPPAGVV